MTTEEHDGDELLRPVEVGTKLRLSKATVYRLIASGELATVTVGSRRATRVRRSDLVDYIARHRRERAS